MVEFAKVATRARMVVTLLHQDRDEKKTKCAICLNEYVAGALVRTLPCVHLFHEACIDEWLNQSDRCPLCRHSVLKSE